MNNCEHDYEAVYCERCDLYMYHACNYCGDISDGGDAWISVIEASGAYCQCVNQTSTTDEQQANVTGQATAA